MNREHWKALLPIIEAFANGEDVQFEQTYREWLSMDSLTFENNPERYRIAPKEKTVWINIYPSRPSACIYPTKEEADSESAPHRIACVQITYREGDGL